MVEEGLPKRAGKRRKRTMQIFGLGLLFAAKKKAYKIQLLHFETFRNNARVY
jgi:hypothetical protein